MSENKIYRALFGSPDKPLRVGDAEIQCYVLEGGIRVLSGRGMQTALSLGQRHGTLLRNFLNNKAIFPFISNRLAMDLENPYRFMRPGRGGKTAVGYEATILADLCDVVLEARRSGVLPERFAVVAEQCEMLTRAFAKVGIIALVDEATGYQAEREKNALEKLLSVYLTEERLKWAKRFPDVFYKEIYRLNKWGWPPCNASKRQGIVGQYTNDVVYERLPQGVLDKLKELNPTNNETGRRRYKHHQFLSEDIGQPDLQKHLLQVIALMKASKSWKHFLELLDRVFPKGSSYQLDMTLD